MNTRTANFQLGLIFLLIAVGMLLIVNSVRANERARIADNEARAAVSLAKETVEVAEAAVTSIRMEMDSVVGDARIMIQALTVIPGAVIPVDPEVEMVLDTVTLNEAVRVAIEMVRTERDTLRVQNRDLRVRIIQIGRVSDQALTDQALFFEQIIDQKDEVILSIQFALDEQIIATDAYRSASHFGFTDKLLWAAVGAGVAAGVSSVTGGN